jgi:hypothetical protein
VCTDCTTSGRMGARNTAGRVADAAFSPSPSCTVTKGRAAAAAMMSYDLDVSHGQADSTHPTNQKDRSYLHHARNVRARGGETKPSWGLGFRPRRGSWPFKLGFRTRFSIHMICVWYCHDSRAIRILFCFIFPRNARHDSVFYWLCL